MVDRNQVAKDREQAQRELNQQLQKFARQLADGQTGMLDRFKVKVIKGAYVLYRPEFDLVFKVTDVAPVMDMSAPPGTLRVSLQCETDVQFIAGVRAMHMVKVGHEDDVTGATTVQPPVGQALDETPAPGPDNATAAPPESDEP